MYIAYIYRDHLAPHALSVGGRRELRGRLGRLRLAGGAAAAERGARGVPGAERRHERLRQECGRGLGVGWGL